MTDSEKIAYLLQERENLVTKIVELYQVIGTMSFYLGYYDNGISQPCPLTIEDMEIALDYAAHPEAYYEDFLPWPKNTKEETAEHSQKLLKAAEIKHDSTPQFILDFDNRPLFD